MINSQARRWWVWAIVLENSQQKSTIPPDDPFALKGEEGEEGIDNIVISTNHWQLK